MRRIATIAAVAVVAVLSTLEMAVGGSGPSGRAAETIRVDSELTSMEQVDNAPAGESAGDLLVFTERLSRNGGRLGEITGSCVLVKPPAGFECTFTASLSRGTLAMSQHAELGKETTRAAITGGTGRFRRARGTAEIQQIEEGREKIIFRILD